MNPVGENLDDLVVTEKESEMIHKKIAQALRDEGRRINKSLD